MDVTQLQQALLATLSPDHVQRTQAEAFLKQHEASPGFLGGLLQLSVEEKLDLGLRQTAAVTFKNIAHRIWEAPKGETTAVALSEPDKQTIRDNIVECLVRAPPQVQVQLNQVVGIAIKADWPERWPGFVPTVMQNIQSGDQQRIYGALIALRMLARDYEFKDEDERQPWNEVSNNVIPTLLEILKALLAQQSNSPDLALFIKIVLKIFWSTTFCYLPVVLTQQPHMDTFLQTLLELLKRPIPLANMPEDKDDREKWPWWKMKKWNMHIVLRLLQRYIDAKAKQEHAHVNTFADYYRANYMMLFLQGVMENLAGLAQGQPATNRVTTLLLQFVGMAVTYKATYAVVKPHVQELFEKVMFPLLCFNAEDMRLWVEGPQEYIRKGYDIMEDFYNPKSAAMNLVYEICQQRAKNHLHAFMAFIISHVQAFKAAGPNPSEVLARQMDGAVFAIGTLNDILKAKSPYKTQLESMLMEFIVPLYTNAYGHLRAKACWLCGVYCDIKFNDGKGQGPTFLSMFQATCNALHDPDLPVKVDAVVGIGYFVDCAEDLAPLKAVMPQLLDILFQLMHQVENEEMVSTLEKFVERFQDEIEPYAVALARNLLLAFEKLTNNKDDDDDDDDLGAIAAYGVLRTLNTLLDAVANNSALMMQMEDILFPLMQKLISTDGQDVLEEILEMAGYLTYYTPQISSKMWSLWPQMYQAWMDWGVDWWEHFLLPFDNFIARGKEVFLSNPDFPNSVYEMAKHAIAGEYEDYQITVAPKLLDLVLQNCRGQVDQYVGPYLQLVLDRLRRAERDTTKTALICVLGSALFYNPALAVRELESRNLLQFALETWFQMIMAKGKSGKAKYFKTKYDTHVSILGLVSIMNVPDDQLPQLARAGLTQLFAGTLKLLTAFKEVLDHEAEEEQEDNESGSDVEGSEYESEDDDDEAEPDAAEEEKRLKKRAQQVAKLLGNGDEDSDDDDDWYDDDDVQTAIDDVDPFCYFQEGLTYMQTTLPDRFQQLTAGMDAATQKVVQDMIVVANHQREKKDEKPEQAAS